MRHSNFFSALILLLLAYTGLAKDIYITPGGEGRADGSIEYPFHSIEEARVQARDFVGQEMVNIYLNDGVYYLERPVIFTWEDGGTEAFPVFYRAVNEGKALISGGELLSVQWTPYKDGIFVCEVPAGIRIDQLFVNNRREEMARFPNSKPGKNVFDCWTLSHSAKADPENDPLSPERIATWKDPSGAYFHAMHRALWGGMHYRVVGKKSNGTLDLEGGWQNNRPDRMHNRYRFIEHVFEELDAPGEWFHEQEDSKLYLYPREDTELNDAVIETVSLRHLFEFNGSMEKAVEHIHLQGLVLKHTARVFMENREPLLRSDWTTYRGGAVTYAGAEYCSVINCEFDQVGGNSIFINNYNRQITIQSCHIHESGANGIAFVGDPGMVRDPIFRYGPQDYKGLDLTPGPKGDNYPSGCLVRDCIITKTGRTEKQTAPIQISMSYRITVSHCSIYDVPRAGINISEGTFGGHIIEFCDVFNTVLETGDHGSFNSWGRDRFWDPDIKKMNRHVADNPELPFLDMLEPNIIRNNRWRCDHGWDVDLDDGSSHYKIYNNLLLNGGLKLREGYHRTVSNNIVVNNGLHPHVWPRRNGDVVRHNIFFTAHKPAVMTRGMGINEKWGEEIDYNIFTSSHKERLLFASNLCDLNSIVTDPNFINPDGGDYTLAEGSAALEMGFMNFDMSAFGVVSPHLKAIAKIPDLPAVLIHTDTSYMEPLTRELSLWKGAHLYEPVGEELSAYGVKMGTRGVALVYASEYSEAYRLGFRTGDFITEINGTPAIGIRVFKDATEQSGDGEMLFTLSRDQVEKMISLDLRGQSEKVNKVLIIGIDGVRPDAMQKAITENLDELWQNGAYSFNARTDDISSSGPCWTAMLTGVWHQKHKVVSNDYQNPDLAGYPHFFRRIREEKPGLETFSVVNWGPIHKILKEGDATYASSPLTDGQVTSEVVSRVKKEEMDVMFVQLDHVDHAGHTYDFSPESEKYLKAIEKSDRQVGRMVRALEKRKSYDQENWLIIVTTDHGGSEHGHGKNIEEHTTIFYIASGSSVSQGEIQGDVNVVDVAVTALEHLDIGIKAEWNLDGRVRGLK
ncbi:MAG: sulfatase-like hydrolase/transferase [Bacteroidetes bacterium]|nr:sulfatase-like hydrolase/transferase [Bacteroidota bacterium]